MDANIITKAIQDEADRLSRRAYWELDDAKRRAKALLYSDCPEKYRTLADQRVKQAADIWGILHGASDVILLMAAERLYPTAEIRLVRDSGDGLRRAAVEAWYEADGEHLHIYISSEQP